MLYTTISLGSKSPNDFAAVLFSSSYTLGIGLGNRYKMI